MHVQLHGAQDLDITAATPHTAPGHHTLSPPNLISNPSTRVSCPPDYQEIMMKNDEIERLKAVIEGLGGGGEGAPILPPGWS